MSNKRRFKKTYRKIALVRRYSLSHGAKKSGKQRQRLLLQDIKIEKTLMLGRDFKSTRRDNGMKYKTRRMYCLHIKVILAYLYEWLA